MLLKHAAFNLRILNDFLPATVELKLSYYGLKARKDTTKTEKKSSSKKKKEKVLPSS